MVNCAAHNGASPERDQNDRQQIADPAAHPLDLFVFLIDLRQRQRTPQQNGNQQPKDDHLLERAVPERSEAFENADGKSARSPFPDSS